MSKTRVSLPPRLPRAALDPSPKAAGRHPQGHSQAVLRGMSPGSTSGYNPAAMPYADGFPGRVLLAPPGDLPTAGPPRDLPKTTHAPALCHTRRGPSRFWGVLGTRARALRSHTAHWSFICDFQTSDSSVGATATSGLTDVRKSRHGAKVHKFWLGKTSRLGNLDIWEPPSVPSQALSQEGGRTRMVRMSLDRQGCIYFQLCLYREGNAYSVV